jgi:hypothetical protein
MRRKSACFQNSRKSGQLIIPRICNRFKSLNKHENSLIGNCFEPSCISDLQSPEIALFQFLNCVSANNSQPVPMIITIVWLPVLKVIDDDPREHGCILPLKINFVQRRVETTPRLSVKWTATGSLVLIPLPDQNQNPNQESSEPRARVTSGISTSLGPGALQTEILPSSLWIWISVHAYTWFEFQMMISAIKCYRYFHIYWFFTECIWLRECPGNSVHRAAIPIKLGFDRLNLKFTDSLQWITVLSILDSKKYIQLSCEHLGGIRFGVVH